MRFLRPAMLALILFAASAGTPAFAQIFLKAPVIAGGPLTAPEPGYGVPLPGATAAENRAALVWNLRSALNVAALQCGVEPLSRIAENYNALLVNHREELASAFTTLTGYFKRRNKAARAAQSAIDTYGTRTYSAYSAVSGIQPFCHVAARTVREAVFQPRTKLSLLAEARLRELHNSVKARSGEQQFPGVDSSFARRLPRLDDACWPRKKKKESYLASCGYISRS